MGRYKLTNCPKCGTPIYQTGGCCGNPAVRIYECPCGEEELRKLEEKMNRGKK